MNSWYTGDCAEQFTIALFFFQWIVKYRPCHVLSMSGLNQVVSEQAVDGSSPLDTMIQRLQQEQDQRLGTNDVAASVNTRASRGKTKS